MCVCVCVCVSYSIKMMKLLEQSKCYCEGGDGKSVLVHIACFLRGC